MPRLLEIMKKTISVKCKECAHTWYIRESTKGEFNAPITIGCPECKKVYRNISYKYLFVGKASTFTMLQPKLGDLSAPRLAPVKVSSPFLIVVIVVSVLIGSIFFYCMLQP